MSKVPVVEHLTHKSGKFIFSCEYDPEVIMPKMIAATILYSAVSELPILPQYSAQLKEDLIRRSIFGTAAIEGNKLTEDEVSEVLSKEKKTKLKNQAELEIDGLKRIYKLLDGKKSEDTWIVREKLIKNVHHVLTARLDYYHNSPGNYRNEPVFVGNAEHGGVYKPPKTLSDIKTLMGIFTEWINSEEMKAVDPMIRACAAHYHLAKIHPFQDGNGRTSRFIEAMILDRAGIKYLPQMMSNYYYKNIDDYFISFSKTQRANNKQDITPFLSFYFDGIISSIKDIKEQVTFFIRKLSLKDFYYFQKRDKKITQRQLELLLLALETLIEFSFSDLFSHPVLKPLYRDVSESTARRDLKKLCDNGYLQFHDEQKKYRTNLLLLG
ncbi:MAG: Fic family protein [Desulfovibrionaceae bacterium]|nr:Fic family protein [Desulfovibrionaceae bacterium]